MKISKKFMCLIGIVGISLLSGCTAGYEDRTQLFNLPPELKDYKVVRLDSTNGVMLFVLVKKENENRPVIGTVQTGKHPVYTIVIDGVNYKLEEQEKEKKE